MNIYIHLSIMKKKDLIKIVQECINEMVPNLMKENNYNSLKNMENKLQAAFKKYEHVDKDIAREYVKKHIETGITLKQLEIDARKNKWNEDTVKVIYRVLSQIHPNPVKQTS